MPLRVGVVGCGSNSDNHLMVYRHARGVELAAVCDINEATAQQKAREWRAKEVFTDYR